MTFEVCGTSDDLNEVINQLDDDDEEGEFIGFRGNYTEAYRKFYMEDEEEEIDIKE